MNSVVLYTGYNDANGQEHRDTLITKAVHDRFFHEWINGRGLPRNASLGSLQEPKKLFFFPEEGKISIRGTIDSLDNVRANRHAQ